MIGKKNNKKNKVYVGMSGGVDSSLSAALLKEQGFDVVGVFIKVWHPDFLPCDWKEERRDAMRVAAHLDIPFKTYDFEKEYKKEVVDYMIEEYKRGRTPNPDVMCNRYVKFGAFLDKAIEEGAGYVATGHYARISSRDEILGASSFKPQAESYRLLKGVDNNKDQSYFLWTLKQEQLKHILFPIGHLEKSQVRKEAEKRGIPVAQKKDSQGICFVGKIDMKDFLKEYIEEKKGDVLNNQCEVIGYHDGAFFYTLGERRGFTITKKTPNDKPYYVVGKNIDKNTITVSNEVLKEGLESTKREVEIGNVSWVSGEPKEGERYQARMRYRQNLRNCKIKYINSNSRELERRVVLIFDELQENVTPGQSLVLYDGEECLGGGIIV